MTAIADAAPLRWIRNWWWARQRAIDLATLWPQCKQLALNMDLARAAFAHHAFNDPAWIDFYGEDRLIEVIGELP
jgi:hypothetical protein